MKARHFVPTRVEEAIDPDRGLRSAAEAELVRLLYKNSEAVLAVTAVVAAVLVVFALWGNVATRTLLMWLAVFLGINALRAVTVSAYNRRRDLLPTPRAWAHLFTVGAAASGLAWGAAALLLFVPNELELTLIVAGLLMGVIAAAGQAHAAYPLAFYCFSVPIVLALAMRFIANGANVYYTWATAAFYEAAIGMFAHNGYRTLAESIRLRLENAQLIERLSEEMRAADEARRVAEHATIAKSKFLAAASHDLRQPLHALALMNESIAADVSTDGRPTLKRMGDAIRSLSYLFQSLLDISRLDAGVIEMYARHCSLETVLDRLVAEYRSAAAVKGVELGVHYGARFVYCDPVGLERVLRNLLTNAVRYTEQGRIEVNVEPDGDRVRIDVSDTGIGIPEKDWENVFSEFHQLANPERDRTKGLGLGLSIVRRLCRLMDADVSVRSVPGQGSTFSVRLPRGDPAQTAVKPAARPGWDLRDSTILVIDDEADILFGMDQLLKRWGCRTLLADSEEAALEALRTSGATPDAIVADYRLRDGRSGIDAIRAVRAALNCDVPGLLITGDTAPERLQEVDRSGLRILHKPVVAAELRTALHHEITDPVV